MVKEEWYENPVVWVVIGVLMATLYFVWPGGSGDYDSFASCLSEAGVVMYGTEWCSHCKAQKKLFGSSFDKINFVDCDFAGDTCLLAGVEGYPTWKINGQNYPGEQSLERLGNLAGCEVVKYAG